MRGKRELLSSFLVDVSDSIALNHMDPPKRPALSLVSEAYMHKILILPIKSFGLTTIQLARGFSGGL
jgi:Mg-chelatase subunit ChlD